MEREEDIIQLIKRVKEGSEKVGVGGGGGGPKYTCLLMAKTSAQSQAVSFCGVLSQVTAATEKRKRRISLGKTTMSKLTKIMKDLGVSTSTKVQLVQTIVFLVILYICEGWTLRKSKQKEDRCI
jgi:hypothetical protein